MSRPPRQLDLFVVPPSRPGPRAPVDWPREIDVLGAQLDPLIQLGASSWTFPGWSGLVYPPGTNDPTLQREGLAMYARYPLFRTVGIDRSYYRPLTRADLQAYATQLPAGFECVEKVWDRLLIPVFPHHPRFGELKGRVNGGFLDAEAFYENVHRPHVGVFEDHLATYVLEFPPMASDVLPKAEAFTKRLAKFLDEAPAGPRFAVELRNPELFTDEYLAMLRERNVAHVYNWWGRMPGLGAQLDRGEPTADFLVVRALLRPGTNYEERSELFAPFDRLQEPSEELRSDVERIARVALGTRRRLLVIVNNKAEGCAPASILELARRLRTLRERAP